MSVASSIASDPGPPYLTDLIQVDQTRDEKTISSAICRYLDPRPEENFVTLEIAFRANNCWSRLFAKETVGTVVSIFRGEPRKYALYITTEDSEIAKARVWQYSGDESTNLIRLRDTGFMFAANSESLDNTLSCMGDSFVLPPY